MGRSDGCDEYGMALQVILPVLSNGRNQESWPSVISNDVIKHTNSLKHQTDVVLGQSKGKTLLPLPAGSEKVSDGDIYHMGLVEMALADVMIMRL